MAYIDEMVSAIIPVYNGESFLAQAFDSVLNQSYKKVEIVVIDDGSTDSTAQIINEYLERYPNIVSKRLSQNIGVDKARNIGLSMASGRYVSFLDADDFWLPEKIEKQLTWHLTNNAMMSCTSIICVYENGDIQKSPWKVKDEISYQLLLRNTMIATSTVIVDRNKVSGFKFAEPFCGGEDYATWLYLLRNGGICFGLNTPLSCHRIRKNSLGANKLESIKQVWYIQTKYEAVSKINALINVFCFILNAINKYCQ